MNKTRHWLVRNSTPFARWSGAILSFAAQQHISRSFVPEPINHDHADERALVESHYERNNERLSQASRRQTIANQQCDNGLSRGATLSPANRRVRAAPLTRTSERTTTLPVVGLGPTAQSARIHRHGEPRQAQRRAADVRLWESVCPL